MATSSLSHSAGYTYFQQFPVSAVVLNTMLTERLTGMPLFLHGIHGKKIISNMLTIVLLTISIFGFYEIATLVSPAHQQATPPAAVMTNASKPAAAAPAPNALARSIPTSITLPSIAVNAPVVSVGLKSDGSIDVPGPNDVGWYNLGPTPGEVGPAVLVGHVDYITTGTAVFWNLRNMQVGDTVQIAREDGKNVTFKVEKVQSYGQDNFPTNEVYGNLTYPGLRIITCTGEFNYLTHHYSDNLVVYARAEL